MQMSPANAADLGRFQTYVENGTPTAVVFRPASNSSDYDSAQQRAANRIVWEDVIPQTEIPY
jgi:hypothetical protein